MSSFIQSMVQQQGGRAGPVSPPVPSSTFSHIISASPVISTLEHRSNSTFIPQQRQRIIAKIVIILPSVRTRRMTSDRFI